MRDTFAAGAKRRRSQRLTLVEPVKVEWQDTSGLNIKALAETAVVNAHGGLLRMKARPPNAEEIQLTRDRTGESTWVRVLQISDFLEDHLRRVSFEFIVPSQTFWRVTIP